MVVTSEIEHRNNFKIISVI